MPCRSAVRAAARAALVMLVTVLAGVAVTGTASAHASLIGSDPSDGATVRSAPTSVRLTFDDALASFEPLVTVTGPDGDRYESGAPSINGVDLTVAVAPLPVAGTYTVAYRVVSGDGHPVQGEIHFELAASGVSPPATSSTAPPSTAPSSTADLTSSSSAASPSGAQTATSGTTDTTATAVSTSTGGPVWPWILAGLLVVLAVVAFVVRRRAGTARRSAGDSDSGPAD